MDKIGFKKRLNQIKEAAFLTGSQKWKVAEPNSDWDIVVSRDIFKRYMEFQIGEFFFYDQKNYNNEDYLFQSFRSHRDYPVNYNFLVMHNMIDYEAYRLATIAMGKLPKVMIKYKPHRILIFTTFRDVLKEHLIHTYPEKYGSKESVYPVSSYNLEDDIPF